MGFLKSSKANKKAQQAQQEITAASIQAEGLRKKQMLLENFRSQRNIIRQTQLARSAAISGASAAGASESSGFFGGLGQISGLGNQALISQAQNAQIGLGLFDANVAKMNAEFKLGKARSDAATGQGLFQLGSSIVSNATAIGKNTQSIGGLFQSGGGVSNPYNAAQWSNTTTIFGGS